MSEALPTLLSVIVGFALGAGWDWWRYHQREAKKLAGVRSLVRREADANLKALDEFWKRVAAMPPPIASPDPGEFQAELDFIKRQRLAQLPYAPRERLMWESQAGYLADAFSEDALNRASTLNGSLDAFVATRQVILDALDENRDIVRDFAKWRDDKARLAGNGTPQSIQFAVPNLLERLNAFNSHTQVQWSDCERLYTEMKSQGNPLK